MQVSVFPTPLRYVWLLLGLLMGLAACQAQPEVAEGQAEAAHPPTGHFAGSLTAAGQPELRVALEVRHPRPGHYDAELLVATEPSLSFVADTLAFSATTLRLSRPGRPGETLTLQQQGNFWRGTLAVDSATYTTLLVRRGPPEPAVYRVRRDEVAGPSGEALLFSPADESLAGAALAIFPTLPTAANAPGWADALARNGYTVLLLPAADTLPAVALTAALTYLRRTPGVDTARVGTWADGPRAVQLAVLLAALEYPRPYPAFVVAQAAPAPGAATRATWRTLGQRTRVLGVYDAHTTQPGAAASLQIALGGRPRVVRTTGPALTTSVVDWLHAL
ncbi:MAG: hypothetical protein ACRYG7_02745 [Janthinobacterium lividum]